MVVNVTDDALARLNAAIAAIAPVVDVSGALVPVEVFRPAVDAARDVVALYGSTPAPLPDTPNLSIDQLRQIETRAGKMPSRSTILRALRAGRWGEPGAPGGPQLVGREWRVPRNAVERERAAAARGGRPDAADNKEAAPPGRERGVRRDLTLSEERARRRRRAA